MEVYGSQARVVGFCDRRTLEGEVQSAEAQRIDPFSGLKSCLDLIVMIPLLHCFSVDFALF